MVLLLGLEIVALGAVASRLPAVRATAREAYRRVAGKGGVAPGPREGEQTQATPASASETGDVVLPASVVSPARVPRATAVAAVALPELWGIPDAAADSLLRHAVILEQLSAAVPRRHGGEAAGAWHLLWATCTHGTSLHHLLRSVASEAALLLVLRDSEGRCFGAFVPTLREPPADGTASAFYGTGEGFLFALATLTLPPLPELQLSSPTPGRRGHDEHICAYTYHWAKGRNEHFVRSDHDRLVLGSGGRSGVGLTCDSDLRFGSSGHCDTYDNPPLPAVATRLPSHFTGSRPSAPTPGDVQLSPSAAQSACTPPSATAPEPYAARQSEAAAACMHRATAQGPPSPPSHSQQQRAQEHLAEGPQAIELPVEFEITSVEVWALDEHATRGMEACAHHTRISLIGETVESEDVKLW